MKRKKEAPVAIQLGKDIYFEKNATIKILNECKKHAVSVYKENAKKELQNALDNGYDVDVRYIKRMTKENAHNIGATVDVIINLFEDIGA